MTAQALSGGRRSAAAAAAAAVAMDGSTAAPMPSGRPWRAQERVPGIGMMLGDNAFCTTMPGMGAGIARIGPAGGLGTRRPRGQPRSPHQTYKTGRGARGAHGNPRIADQGRQGQEPDAQGGGAQKGRNQLKAAQQEQLPQAVRARPGPLSRPEQAGPAQTAQVGAAPRPVCESAQDECMRCGALAPAGRAPLAAEWFYHKCWRVRAGCGSTHVASPQGKRRAGARAPRRPALRRPPAARRSPALPRQGPVRVRLDRAAL